MKAKRNASSAELKAAAEMNRQQHLSITKNTDCQVAKMVINAGDLAALRMSRNESGSVEGIRHYCGEIRDALAAISVMYDLDLFS